MKILGTTITNSLSWNKNTRILVQKVNKRMLLIKKIQSFGASVEELVHLWIVYCRSVLEQSAVVWSSSLTAENKADLERTQKGFAKQILKSQYKSFGNSLMILNLPTLEKRRSELTLKFAKDCLKNEKFSNLFPENEHRNINTRFPEKYEIPHCNTQRMKSSSLNTMRHQLNQDHRETQNCDS